jgi:hypothetical protein
MFHAWLRQGSTWKQCPNKEYSLCAEDCTDNGIHNTALWDRTSRRDNCEEATEGELSEYSKSGCEDKI